MLIDRYIMGEIGKPMLAICTILVAIFASYRAAGYLADAAAGLLSGTTVLYLVMLRVAVALEVLIPTTLYFSVVVALSRMYTDSEITALSSCGVRPWAYEQSYWLKARAKTKLDMSLWKEDNFYEVRRMNRVVFADKIDHERNRAKGVFIQSDHGDRVQVIYAKEAYQHIDKKTGGQVLLFLNGYLYEFSRIGDEGHIMKFEQSTLSLEPPEIEAIGYKRKAAHTLELAGSDKLEDIAELQWRLSTPLTTILLALLGVPLSRTAPRSGRYAKVGTAILIYAVYYNTSAMAKNWVEQGVVGTMPGIWWVDALLAGLLLILLLQPTLAFWWWRR